MEDIYCKALTYAIMETETSHDLPSAIWSPRDGINPVEGRRKHVPAQAFRQQEGIPPSSTFLFYLGSHWIGWCSPTLGRAVFFTQSPILNANLIQQQLHRHIQK